MEKLNKKLVDSDNHIIVLKDDAEAELEEIASRHYDFVICVPGLQKKMCSEDKLPPIFYLESLEYHNLLVSKTVDNINASLV